MKKIYKTVILFIIFVVIFTALFCLSIRFYFALLCSILTSVIFVIADCLFEKNKYLDILLIICIGISLSIPTLIKSNSLEEFIWDFVKFIIMIEVFYLINKHKTSKNNYPIPPLDKL